MLAWHDGTSNLDSRSSIHSPSSSISISKCFILQPRTSNLLHQLHFSIFNSFSSILSQKNRIFDSKSPQNSVISEKMTAREACTACSFFQVCLASILKLSGGAASTPSPRSTKTSSKTTI